MPDFRRYNVLGYCYFVTANVRGKKPIFLDKDLCRLILENLGFYRRKMGFKVLGYVVMPDHLHLIIQTDENATISEIMRSFKSYTGKHVGMRLNWLGGCWQPRYHDRALRSERLLRVALEYIHNNPVAAGLVKDPAEYEFSSHSWYHSRTGPLAMDDLER